MKDVFILLGVFSFIFSIIYYAILFANFALFFDRAKLKKEVFILLIPLGITILSIKHKLESLGE